MKKQEEEKKPEEIAKDLESYDFEAIEEAELQQVFGGIGSTNTNCCC